MGAHSESYIPQQSSSLDLDLDSLLQIPPHSTFNDGHPSQQSTIKSFGQVTPQTTLLLAEDPQTQSTFNGDQIRTLNKAPAASVQAQDFFVHSTSVLKASFLKTPNPSEPEISRLATRTGLDEYRVSTWFDIIKSLLGDRGLKTLPTPEMTQAFVPPSSSLSNMSEFSSTFSVDRGLSATIEDLPTRLSQNKASKRRRRSSTGKSRPSKRQRKEKDLQNKNPSLALDDHRDLSQRYSGKALKQGKFCCPTCSFKTGKMDQWYTHQSRKHFPSEIFVCRMDSGQKPCSKGLDDPFKRKANFTKHLKECHGYESGELLDEEVSRCTAKVTGLYHDKCGFCSKTLDTREDSMAHIGRHIEDGDAIDDWIHQCTSLDHKLKHHVHFDILPDEIEIDDDDDDDDSDDDDTDQGGFGGWTQGGDYDPGEPWDSCGGDPDQGPGEGNSYGGTGGAYLPMRSTTAAKSVVSQRVRTLKQVTLPECLEQDFCHVRPLQSFTVQRTLGKGGFGTVLEVSQDDLDRTFALKTIPREQSGPSNALDYDAFKNEVRIMRSLRHPHIVQLLNSYVEPERFSLLLDPVADMDLAEYLRDTEKLLLEGPLFLERSRVLLGGMSSLAAALKETHFSSVAHGDIKPSNILIKGENFLLADFGVSKMMSRNGNSNRKNVLASPKYAAPETTKSRTQNEISDIFSLGCVFLEMATLCMTRTLSEFAGFRTAHGDNSFHKTLGKTNEWIDKLNEEQERTKCSDIAHSIPFDMIRKMLRGNPEDRPTAHEVWLRFPRCTCCSDWQATNHQPPSNQGDVEDQAPRTNFRACTPFNCSGPSNKSLPPRKLRTRLRTSSAPLDEQRSRQPSLNIRFVHPSNKSRREDPMIE